MEIHLHANATTTPKARQYIQAPNQSVMIHYTLWSWSLLVCGLALCACADFGRAEDRVEQGRITLVDGTARTLLPANGEDGEPAWSLDGEHIFFSSKPCRSAGSLVDPCRR